MNLEFRDFVLLEAIDHHGSFSAAAHALGRTRSAITQHIHKLEDQLRIQIFDRASYRPQFTPEGRLVLDRGRPILRQLEHLKGDLNLMGKGWEAEFSLAVDDLLDYRPFYPLIQEFQRQAPGVEIRLYREVLNGTWEALLKSKALLAIGVTNEPPLGFPVDQMELGNVSFVFAISPSHPLAKAPEPLTLEALREAYSIVISDTSQHLMSRSTGIFSGQSVMVVPHMEAKIAAQVAGLGVGFVPRQRIQNQLSRGELIIRKVAKLKTQASLKIAWRRDTTSKALDWFLERLRLDTLQQHILGKDL